MATRRKRAKEMFPCPVCGTDVDVDAPGCRECGSTRETGWSEETEYDGLDLPEPDGDDEPEERRYSWWVVILLVLAAAATVWVSMW